MKAAVCYRFNEPLVIEDVTGRYPFERINEAIESSAAGEALRNVLIL